MTTPSCLKTTEEIAQATTEAWVHQTQVLNMFAITDTKTYRTIHVTETMQAAQEWCEARGIKVTA